MGVIVSVFLMFLAISWLFGLSIIQLKVNIPSLLCRFKSNSRLNYNSDFPDVNTRDNVCGG